MDVFTAVADPGRRTLLDVLLQGPKPAGELVDALPGISQPAVSRHLKVLKEAGLVVEEPQGTRRIYRLDDRGIAEVERFLTEVWGDAVGRFRLMAENTKPRRAPRKGSGRR